MSLWISSNIDKGGGEGSVSTLFATTCSWDMEKFKRVTETQGQHIYRMVNYSLFYPPSLQCNTKLIPQLIFIFMEKCKPTEV